MTSENKEITGSFDLILTEHAEMKEVVRIAKAVAVSDVNILLMGESGTGKNFIAEAIHNASHRSSGPFINLNCLAIPETLTESELFGHEKGAFTDAYIQKKGSFEAAEKGTIYLDEIGDMTRFAQGKILEAIDTKSFRRVGSEQIMRANVRIIAATNQDLSKRVEDGSFRKDLYYRLKEVLLYLPPLRERKNDISLLVHYFIRLYGEKYQKPDLNISDATMKQLIEYQWPGNARELRNAVRAAILLCPGKTLWLEHFPFEFRLKTEFQAEQPEGLSIDNLLKSHVLKALQFCKFNKKKTAECLNISRPRLDRYMEKYGLQSAQKK